VAIEELWIPSPHYTASRDAYNVAAFHTTQGAMRFRDLGAWFQNPSAQCSSHHGADQYERGVFGAYVYENHTAWTAAGANRYSIQIELCAYAEWSRSTWLSKPIIIDNAAEWLHYICEKYEIPYTLLNNSQAQSGSYRGIAQHFNFGAMGSGHWDCGEDTFPIDVILDKARNWSGGSAGSKGGITVAGSARDGSGRLWSVGSWDGNCQLNFKIGNGVFSAIDSDQSGAIGGPTISFDKSGDRMDVTYINSSKKMCLYTTQVSPVDWVWSELGGKFQA